MQLKMSLAREQHYHGAARLGGTGGKPGGGRGNMKPPTRPKVPEGHFDPEELTVRLMQVLADQRAHAERKRRAAAAAAGELSRNHESSNRHHNHHHHQQQHHRYADPSSSNEQHLSRSRRRSSTHGLTNPDSSTTSTNTTAAATGEYHHVPQEAAKQFARTTTAQQMRSNDFIHLLHRRAFQNSQAAQNGGHASASFDDPLSPPEVARQLRQSQAQRDRALAAASSSGQDQQHTFQAEFSRLQRRHSIPAAVANSTAAATTNNNKTAPTSEINAHRRRSVLGLESHLLPSTIPERAADPNANDNNNNNNNTHDFSPSGSFNLVEAANEHRAVDWTQSDEARLRTQAQQQQQLQQQQQPPQQQQQNKPTKQKLLLSPLLRPAQSIFGLRGKIGSKAESGEGGGGGGGELKSPKSPRDGGSSGGGFFGRFKR